MPFIPKFSEEEKEIIKGSSQGKHFTDSKFFPGSTDFIGINYYLSFLVRAPKDGEKASSQSQHDGGYVFVEGKWDKLVVDRCIQSIPQFLQNMRRNLDSLRP